MTYQLHQGDCAEVMARELADDSIGLTVTSPPYDNLRDYNGYTFDFEAIAEQLWRVTKPGGVVVWVVADRVINGSESGTSFQQALGFMNTGFRLHDTMIYAKTSINYPDSTRYYQVFEYMFVFSKGAPETFNPIKDRKNKYGIPWGKLTGRDADGVLKERTSYHKGRKYGVRFNIWRYHKGGGFIASDELAHEHPAIFPESLARDHIISWSNPGDIVLDPMCGSGTTGKMAILEGRQFIGIDISGEYLDEIAQPRLEQAAEAARQLELELG